MTAPAYKLLLSWQGSLVLPKKELKLGAACAGYLWQGTARPLCCGAQSGGCGFEVFFMRRVCLET